MEIKMEAGDELGLSLAGAESVVERLAAAASALERAAERLAGLSVEASHAGLEERLAEAEATIAALKASGRKTAAVGSLVAKEGPAYESGGLDAALGSLSVEQRIAVKAGLMRAGLV